ncbi:t-SNARE complex subunit/syntaxin [Tubulinosema ratisbonensis]|uniref:t-SNARE complex subunit/syntaxin n=1 Tax=Tubulinosema ratisbonensis TaxID=291195 RepID=A0A437AHC5_9MICR|nr:t-SNARE complex subunit/syntaxin [Tubulinosema ratisbonensis]
MIGQNIYIVKRKKIIKMVDIKFLNKITLIQNSIKKLQQYREKYRELCYTKVRDFPNEEEEKKINKNIETLADLFKSHTERIKSDLEELDIENKKVKEIVGEDSSDYQIRNVQFQKVTQDLKTEINKFRAEQLKYKKEESNRLKNQYMIVNQDADEKEVDKIINSENSEQILQQVIAGGSSSDKKKLKSVEDRNKKIKDLTKRIDELLTLINDLQEMVNKSGNVINKIEVKMAKTESNTDVANKDLDTALRYQVARMWIKRIIYLIVGIALLVGVIWLISKVVPSWGGKSDGKNNSDGKNK